MIFFKSFDYLLSSGVRRTTYKMNPTSVLTEIEETDFVVDVVVDSASKEIGNVESSSAVKDQIEHVLSRIATETMKDSTMEMPMKKATAIDLPIGPVYETDDTTKAAATATVDGNSADAEDEQCEEESLSDDASDSSK
jgi:hypothetical protein